MTAIKKTTTFVEYVLVAASVAAYNISCDYCRISKENLVGYVVLNYIEIFPSKDKIKKPLEFRFKERTSEVSNALTEIIVTGTKKKSK